MCSFRSGRRSICPSFRCCCRTWRLNETWATENVGRVGGVVAELLGGSELLAGGLCGQIIQKLHLGYRHQPWSLHPYEDLLGSLRGDGLFGDLQRCRKMLWRVPAGRRKRHGRIKLKRREIIIIGCSDWRPNQALPIYANSKSRSPTSPTRRKRTPNPHTDTPFAVILSPTSSPSNPNRLLSPPNSLVQAILIRPEPGWSSWNGIQRAPEANATRLPVDRQYWKDPPMRMLAGWTPAETSKKWRRNWWATECQWSWATSTSRRRELTRSWRIWIRLWRRWLSWNANLGTSYACWRNWGRVRREI